MTHNGPMGRRLIDGNKQIIGVGEKMNLNSLYINKIGATHLANNDYRSKRHYNELDVYNFDQNKFIQKLNMPDHEDPDFQTNIEKQVS